ncbi:DUF6361 family protein [Azospirillum sp. TSO35-2]|uniref:DUF6361 family protein n=1 Tax=Azospirillum sp. TSO35-2 TaxID=716796 RepID=UPI000D61224E|nr:DUF6361 family protein [Azospirillum sp. TSO35-2]PWC39112.1 hypothetical protein TSO352_02465 [Azospirillum sp. TSO35-2]
MTESAPPARDGLRFLGWLDYDEAHEKAARDALAALRGRDARDELGLGSVRDTLSDLFFPGTSTIQRRLRYFLFVAWCCEAAARGRKRSVSSALRENEVRLIDTLAPLGEGAGVIGLQKGADLLTMPSSIYWSGLRTLGIVTLPGSTARWARHVEERRASDAPPAEEPGQGSRVPGFAFDLPPMPDGFPNIEGLDFNLPDGERIYLKGRLSTAVAARDGWGLEHNLFTHFCELKAPTNASFPWRHPLKRRLPAQTRHYLDFAAAFSRVMYGATLLYNCLLSRLRMEDGADAERHVLDYRKKLEDWARDVTPVDLDVVSAGMGEIAQLAGRLHHTIDNRTILFVRRWIEAVRDGGKVEKNPAACDLIRRREEQLKRHLGTSRFYSEAARKRWRFQAGGRLEYRWTIARSYLNDLAEERDA